MQDLSAAKSLSLLHMWQLCGEIWSSLSLGWQLCWQKELQIFLPIFTILSRSLCVHICLCRHSSGSDDQRNQRRRTIHWSHTAIADEHHCLHHMFLQRLEHSWAGGISHVSEPIFAFFVIGCMWYWSSSLDSSSICSKSVEKKMQPRPRYYLLADLIFSHFFFLEQYCIEKWYQMRRSFVIGSNSASMLAARQYIDKKKVIYFLALKEKHHSYRYHPTNNLAYVFPSQYNCNLINVLSYYFAWMLFVIEREWDYH